LKINHFALSGIKRIWIPAFAGITDKKHTLLPSIEMRGVFQVVSGKTPPKNTAGMAVTTVLDRSVILILNRMTDDTEWESDGGLIRLTFLVLRECAAKAFLV